VTDFTDLARCLRKMLDSGYFQAICRGEETTSCADTGVPKVLAPLF
jgi:hypothetical protein